MPNQNKNIVLTLLRSNDPLSDNVCKKLLSIKRESRILDFKRRFESSVRGWCDLIKDIIAMANTDGGYIIIGANDDGSCSGDDLSFLKDLDQAQIVDKISKYTEQQPDDVDKKYFKDGDKERVILHVGFMQPPIIFTNPGDYTNPDGKKKSVFGKGTVYFRHGSKSEFASQTDIRCSFEKMFTRRRQEILKGVQQAVKIKPNEKVVICSKKEREVRVSDKADAFPVRITNNPNAPAFRNLIGTGKFDSFQDELAALLRTMQTNPEAYASESQLVEFYRHRHEIKFNHEELKCLLVSSIYRHCPPYYWASKLGKNNVKNICIKEVNKDSFPAIRVVVHLAHILGGITAKKILEEISKKSSYKQISKSARDSLSTICDTDRVWNKYGRKTISVHTSKEIKRYNISKDKLDVAEKILDDILSNNPKEYVKLKESVKLLDILVYGTRLEKATHG